MDVLSNMRAVAAGPVSAALVISTSPAEAGGLRRGFLPVLIAGVAVGALAASAPSSAQSTALYTAVPDEVDTAIGSDDSSVRRFAVIRQRARHMQAEPRAHRPSKPAEKGTIAPHPTGAQPATVTRSAFEALDRCREAIQKDSRRHGATDVSIATAGAVERRRDGTIAAPLRARIEYRRRGQRQVRHAQLICHVTADGQVEAFR